MYNPVTKALKIAAICVLLTVVIGCVVNADTTWTTNFDGSAIKMDASVTWQWNANTGQNEYLYQYILTFNPGTSRRLTGLSIGNPNHSAFNNAENNQHYYFNPANKPNPSDPTRDSIQWSTYISMPTGNTVTFWFYSLYTPQKVDTTASGVSSGFALNSLASNGEGTIGMSNEMVPEPAMLATMGCGISAGLFAVRRRRR